MTIGEYIKGKLHACEISDAQLLDVSIEGGFSLDDEYSALNAKESNTALASIILEYLLAPKRTNISESGFSVSWDYDGLAKYYLLLCRKWGIDNDNADLLGLTVIKDISDTW